MQLVINNQYRVCVGEDIELEKEYEYYVCVAELDDYYVLHDFEKYCELNGMDSSSIEDLDEYFINVKELDYTHYKKVNSLESAYYKTKEVEHTINNKAGRKFIKV